MAFSLWYKMSPISPAFMNVLSSIKGHRERDGAFIRKTHFPRSSSDVLLAIELCHVIASRWKEYREMSGFLVFFLFVVCFCFF